MRLLVSVRDASEAADAVAGGADIVDAKEPTLGPLAPVSPVALQSINAAVPLAIPLSVALGDAHPTELGEIVAAVGSLQPRRALYFKAALIATSPRAAAPAIAAAAGRLAARPDRPALIVARYVDAPADASDLADWVDVCAASGAHGLLLDTSRKAGATLFASVGVHALSALRRRATRQGIWLALAGGMTIDDLERLGDVRPHVLGVRGAVCDGARTGVLSSRRVEQLRQAMDGVKSPLRAQVSPA
jgi:(5-formylfuran-3-yl)methyl phosphate synthase